jgi:alpha-1,3-rhamnosyl/mannosyltransferase
MNTTRSASNGSGHDTHSVRFLSNNRPGPRMGMGHYERLLIHHLIQQAQDSQDGWKFSVTFDGRNPEQPVEPSSIEPGLESVDFVGFSTARFSKMPWPLTRAAMTQRFRKSKPDLYHSLALGYPPPDNAPVVFTIHDLPPARFPDEGTVPSWAKQAAQAAQAILTPSEFAKRELVELLQLKEDRVHVIYYGCEHDRFHPDVAPADAETLAQHGITTPFLIYVGGFTQRKNVRNLLAAWKILEPRHPDLSLVLVGPTDQLQAIAQEAALPRVIVSGYMDRNTLPGVLKASTALVFPSTYEGFGMPPQEAMALGVPVVAVRSGGAIPEVVGDAGILAENGLPDSIAASVQHLLDDNDLAQKLKVEGPKQVQRFSWPKHAQEVMAVYKSMPL